MRRYAPTTAATLARGMHPDDARVFLAGQAPMTSTARQRGRQAQASGQSLEARIDSHHETARWLGLADLEHQHPAVLIRDGVPVKLLARSGPDYRGVLRGGRAIAVEAKSAGTGRLALVDTGLPRFDGLKAHQRKALERCMRLGGVALVFVRFVRQRGGVPTELLYAVPFEHIASCATIGPEDCDGWQVCDVPYLRRFADGT